MRAFVGIPVPEAWIGPLMRAQGAVPGGRAVEPDDLHVTLAFLDDQPEDRLEDLHEALEARALPEAVLRAAAYAPISAGRAVVLDLAADPGLAALHEAVRGAVRAAGIALPRARLRPHVTLRRASRRVPFDMGRLPARLAALGAPGMAPAPAGTVALWGSTLTPEGPIYETLATYRAPSARRTPTGRASPACRPGSSTPAARPSAPRWPGARWRPRTSRPPWARGWTRATWRGWGRWGGTSPPCGWSWRSAARSSAFPARRRCDCG